MIRVAEIEYRRDPARDPATQYICNHKPGFAPQSRWIPVD
jgi:hypothetical protein